MSHVSTSSESEYDFQTDLELQQRSADETKILELSKPQISLFKKSYYFSTLKNSTSVTYDILLNSIKLSGSDELVNKRMVEILKWQLEIKILHVDVQKKFGENLAEMLPFLERINESNEIQVEECNEHEPNHECLALFYNEIDKESAFEEFSKRYSIKRFDLSQDRIKTCIRGISLSVIGGDITEEEADVIVCSTPANLANLSIGIMSNAVLQKSGPALQETCKKKGYLELGDIFVTDKFDLQYCKNIFHVTLGYVEVCKNLILYIGEILTSCLEKAGDKKLMSIAFPTIGFGLLERGYSQVKNSDLIKAYFDSVEQFVDNHHNNNNHLKEIKFVIKDDSLFKDFKTHLKSLTDSNSFWRN